ncbi:hypothetical protein [Dyadobacter beijingensis]|nr:hypothetical protein [Dyadobacter beijingensis]
MFNKAKYLSLLVLLGAWGCTSNQYASRSGGSNDDLYGGSSGGGLVLADRGGDQEVTRLDNPDYAYTGKYSEEGTADYYDENYLSSRAVKRQVSTDVGYNAGFVDGYNSASLNNPYYGGLGSFWPGSYAGLALNFGYGGMRMRPYVGFGYGSMFGYSPWSYGSMLSWGYDPFGYNSWGYNPWGYNSMYGWGGGYYDSFYGGYGYSPWAYSRPVIVINNPERGIARTYGPRVVDAGGSRSSNERYNSNFVNSSRNRSSSGERVGRDGNRVISGDTYSSPRSARGAGRGEAVSNGRGNADAYSSRGVGDGGSNTYYSRPRSANSSNYSSDNANTGNNTYYSSPRSSRGSSSSYSAPTYSAPTRSQSDYSTPSTRSYSSPRSESYSAPTRTYSQPSYSAPSRSYSAPSGGGGGGGGSSRSSRGPR